MPRRFGLQVLLLLALLVSPLFSSAQEPAYARPESHVGIGVKFSTMGAGIEAAIPITSNTNLRGGFNIFSYSRRLDRDGIHYAGDWSFRSVQATFDWFPFHGAFHLSPGVLVYNGNEFTAVANAPAGQTFTLGGTTYASSAVDPVHGNGKIEFNKAAPMVLAGWGNLIPRSGKRFSFPFEFGVAFSGAPTSSLFLAGTACDASLVNCRAITSDPTIQANIQSERRKIDDDLSSFKVYPIISIGFAFNF
jgi:hypothetical protein